ncbi:UNVERIFIED_CONTAM: hypothetical protein GTU68_017059 [Idotea baltica]|nr:hypothetical protein [Idotea baltica]
MLRNFYTLLPLVLASVAVTSCSSSRPTSVSTSKPITVVESPEIVEDVPVVYEKRSPKRVAQQPRRQYKQIQRSNSFNDKLSVAALNRLRSKVRYDGSYLKIGYPGGDVPSHIGVCTDVVIRSYRQLGVDLQEQVHRDMSSAFHAYPNPRKWGLSRPDTNIDHRRVYNLRQFFQRRGAALPITRNPRDYKPGDIVSWMVGPDLPHIGLVVNKRSKADPNRFMIVHNIAHGPQLEDVLFAFPITGHYRYNKSHMGNIPQGIYTQKKRSYNNALTQAQLAQAANLLGTNYSNKPVVQTVSAAPQNNQNLLDQVVRLNSLGPAVKSSNGSSIKMANLSNAEIQALLTK